VYPRTPFVLKLRRIRGRWEPRSLTSEYDLQSNGLKCLFKENRNND
jgi:hypothetical protein